jgi:hypothetical protein
MLCWILEQSMGAKNRVELGCRTGPPGYIDWRPVQQLGPYSIPSSLRLF